MTLGTPVVTSGESSLPEIAGYAALLVDPCDADDIVRAITTIVSDADLRAEFLEAAKFSVERYRERVESLYASTALNIAAGGRQNRMGIARSPVPFVAVTG